MTDRHQQDREDPRPAPVVVTVPPVPEGADVYKSWRRVVTAINDQAEGPDGLIGADVEAGARVEVPAGALILVSTATVTGHAYTQYGRRYPTADAAVSLLLADTDGTLSTLWSRHFKRDASAFGTATRLQVAKHLAAHPPAGGTVREVEAGPGRPNLRDAECRWCGRQVRAHSGVLVGRGKDAQVEHRDECTVLGWQPTQPTPCARCGVNVAPQTAQLVVRRDGSGEREARHLGRCEGKQSWENAQDAAAAYEAALQAGREAAAKKAEQAAARRQQAAARKADKDAVLRAAAADAEARVTAHGVTRVTASDTPYDKGLSPAGDRMRLVHRTAELGDGSSVEWWDVEVYGGYADPDSDGDNRGGRYFLLSDARAEYQSHSWQAAPPAPHPAPSRPAGPPPAATGTTSPWSFSAGEPGTRPRYRPGLWEPLGTVLRTTLYTARTPLPADTPGYIPKGEAQTSAIVTVVGEDKPYYSRADDGMNTLLEMTGEDGWVHTVYVRPATAQEAAPLLAREAAAAHRQDLRATLKELTDWRAEDAQCPPAPDLTGAQQVTWHRHDYLPGVRDDELYVIGDTMYWCVYNGMDGDNWDRSNWGPFIAWSFPMTPERRALVDALRTEYGQNP